MVLSYKLLVLAAAVCCLQLGESAHILRRKQPAAAPAPAPGAPAPTTVVPAPAGKHCPGTPTCNNRGTCDEATGVCFCDAGFAGTDCSGEAPMFMEVTRINNPELQDMLGLYRMDGMYLFKNPKAGPVDPAQTKFMHYDHASKGWAVSKFNSSCIDDTCFFGYNPEATAPQDRGYVFGGPELHVYYEQLIFDEAKFNPRLRPGFKYRLAYQPDPSIQGVPDLSEFNGNYVVQPRYTHVANKKYALYPISFEAPGKTWIVTGLMGEPRKRQIILKAQDPSLNKYIPPKDGWMPEELGFQLRPACMNHVGDLACLHLKPLCMSTDSDGGWARQCCRNTCGSCGESRFSCGLPKVDNLAKLAN